MHDWERSPAILIRASKSEFWRLLISRGKADRLSRIHCRQVSAHDDSLANIFWTRLPTDNILCKYNQKSGSLLHATSALFTANLLSEKSGQHEANAHGMLAYLAIDQARTMTDILTYACTGVKCVYVLQMSFSDHTDNPIWSIFLSTARKFNQFASAAHFDISILIILGILVVVTRGFQHAGIDHLATKFRDD